ncbi:translational GTPase TypA [Prosthecobacter vanneervenii]|uniref:Large ribosomal subunit assembly factor BipA n=1 Tax=Prosthecobacter vanneervenii TaxID=48466 RepID=A0A7W7Y6J6_9BACT|nr:translational GTPase TypA [Prosthecobacter vanneervenii]MBB5030541.1 GTP-binding protein [Prosthecobacter vanneervenii]
MTPDKIRNIAIIAHVDHGKTTLVDGLLRASGNFRENQAIAERAMDSMDLEREKGITIKAKNTSVHWNDYIINIVDTPGHADFGGEVERVMKMVDGVMLVVDAYEGPQAQTRFVLKKALEQGIKPIVLINKMDRPHIEPQKVHDKVLELFLELDATEEQFNAAFVYGSARAGWVTDSPTGEQHDMTFLLGKIVEHIPAPKAQVDGCFEMLVSNIDWDNFVGRVAIGKITRGTVKLGDKVFLLGKTPEEKAIPIKVTKVFQYTTLTTSDSAEGIAGDIVGISGFEDVDIGQTVAGSADAPALPFVAIDPPTIVMQFAVNDGPLAGREGEHVTSRKIRDRLDREQKMNVTISVKDTDTAGIFDVSARGAMQIAVLVEQMRREGFEVLVSRPMVIMKRVNDELVEPFETLYVDVPDDYLGGVMKSISERKGKIEDMSAHNGRTSLQAYVPTRGLIGFEFELMNLTSGHGIHSHLFREYAPHAGPMQTRSTGTLVSTEAGEATSYALDTIQVRGKLFIGAGEQVYDGMIIGENPRADDLPVNPTRSKQLTNFRAAGNDKGIQLTPPIRFSLERAIEYIAPDELAECTPKSIRIRKRILDSNVRQREKKKTEAQLEGAAA